MTLCRSDLAYSLVSDRIFGSAQLVERLRSGVKSWLNWERENRYAPIHLNLALRTEIVLSRREHRQREVIPALIAHLVRHHQYSAFEEYYINVTRDFYLEESTKKARDLKNDPKTFFNHARSRINEEAARSKAILPLPSWGILREITEHALWDGKLEWLADSSEFPSL